MKSRIVLCLLVLALVFASVGNAFALTALTEEDLPPIRAAAAAALRDLDLPRDRSSCLEP